MNANNPNLSSKAINRRFDAETALLMEFVGTVRTLNENMAVQNENLRIQNDLIKTTIPLAENFAQACAKFQPVVDKMVEVQVRRLDSELHRLDILDSEIEDGTRSARTKVRVNRKSDNQWSTRPKG